MDPHHPHHQCHRAKWHLLSEVYLVKEGVTFWLSESQWGHFGNEDVLRRPDAGISEHKCIISCIIGFAFILIA